LRIYTETNFPQEWATTQNNLGSAYGKLPTGNRVENLRQSIACLQAASRVCTEADFPQDWAGTQFNLGLTFAILAQEMDDLNLLRAAREYFAVAERGFKSVGLADDAADARNCLASAEMILAGHERTPPA
jgi:hypothetical protein